MTSPTPRRPAIWYFASGTIRRVLVMHLRKVAGAVLDNYLIRCGSCGIEWVQEDSVGFSVGPDGALSTTATLACPTCPWRVQLVQGVVTPVPELWCPSCGFKLRDPPHYGWSMCTAVCGWEGRTSETLVEPPDPEPIL